MLEQYSVLVAVIAGALVVAAVVMSKTNPTGVCIIPQVVTDNLNSRIRQSGGFIRMGILNITSAAQLITFQVLCCMGSLVLAALSAVPLHPLILFPAITAMSFYAPIIKLNRAIEKRRQKILSELPGVMEIIAMVMEAGLSFDSAVIYIGEHRKGLVASLLKRSSAEIDAGIKRETAYEKVAGSGSREIKTFINAVLIAEAQGRPVKQTIIDMARTFREQQKNEIEAKANKLPSTMLIPIFVCIVPPILLVYLLPALQNLEALF